MPINLRSERFQPAREIPVSRLRALLRDYCDLLGQQMYFWGRDVIHPRGNLLCENGFDRRASEGLEGTSVYRKSLDGGAAVELHGACAGLYDLNDPDSGHFLYIRNKKRCFLYSADAPPAPGFYAMESLANGPALDLYFSSLRFLDWWLEYESWIEKRTDPTWRYQCYEAFSSLPASRPSLPPREAILWLSQYRRNPSGITRIRERMRSIKT
ncbi:MAG: hypothetical protein CMO61_14515 [Verrucomicrobiales bacterium]|nr:hypothetical protein [Verrucomicrobiales bacterium]|tara:strand:- start:7261 stop:7896 length:636 start_codon:yes stop_codon:yes gene_type:complete